jgi:hypothetical protein
MQSNARRGVRKRERGVFRWLQLVIAITRIIFSKHYKQERGIFVTVRDISSKHHLTGQRRSIHLYCCSLVTTSLSLKSTNCTPPSSCRMCNWAMWGGLREDKVVSYKESLVHGNQCITLQMTLPGACTFGNQILVTYSVFNPASSRWTRVLTS